MFRIGTLTLLCSVAICSFGFTMNRSEFIESTWDTAPSLDTYQRMRIDPVANDRMQMTNIHGISQVPNVRVLEKLPQEAVPENSTREKRSEVIINGTIGLNPPVKFIRNTESAINNDSSKSFGESRKTRNVILLLIDEKDQKAENLWQDYVRLLPSAIEGSFQSCRDENEINASSLGKMSITEESVEKDCDCEYLLHANIEELLSWVRNTLRMATGTVSFNNFLILSPLIHKDLSSSPADFHESRKVNEATLEARKNNDESNNSWRIIEHNERAQTVSSLFDSSFYKTEPVPDYGNVWNVFDVLSKISIAFFRSLLELLKRSDNSSADEIHEEYPWLQPSFLSFLGNTNMELKSMGNSKGYILIVIAPRNETADAIDLLQHQISDTNDTLLIVTYPCFGDKKPIPFIAQGPNSEILRETKIIWELPIAIRKAISSDCYDFECTDRQRVNVTNRILSRLIETFLRELLPEQH